MLELRDFQQQASDQIADRFRRYFADPPLRGSSRALRRVPFFQALASITASGKTVILADAVAAMAASLPIAPVVVWLSKGKVVVEQTFANLSPGGKYNHLLGDTYVEALAGYDANAVSHATEPLLYFATVGTFNQKDKEKGERKIFQSDIDNAEESTWEALKIRLAHDGHRRPLLVVYDEGHNLSDQQTDLLLELEPDAFLVASATMRLPARLSNEINQLKATGWTDDDLVTAVSPSAVAESGLIKSTVQLVGYEAPMEETISAMLADLEEASAEAAAQDLGAPKSIYVCKTNIVEGDAFRRDDPKQPFASREAPPIVIWRYLVDQCKIVPEAIAVYCTLRFDKNYPPPSEFHLFAGGDKDYDRFLAGDFTHVIFNLGLQEGWDDPLCCFAYVDKSMESNVAVEQLVGRLLRQPGAQPYPSARLNTAHFYVRVDKRKTFKEIIDNVGRHLEQEAPEVRLLQSPPGRAKPVALPPRKIRVVHETGYDTTQAKEPVRQVLVRLSDYSHDDGTNTRATGGRGLVQRNIGTGGQLEFAWEEFEHTNAVSARWIFQREVLRRFPNALGVADTNHPKFDAMIGLAAAPTSRFCAPPTMRWKSSSTRSSWSRDVVIRTRLGRCLPTPKRSCLSRTAFTRVIAISTGLSVLSPMRLTLSGLTGAGTHHEAVTGFP
jgi:type III restriction enzyme